MLIVNPNFTIDRTIPIDTLRPGHVARTGTAVETLGGKGVNVARVARAFGRVAPVVGFVAERTAIRFADLAADEGAELCPVSVPGVGRATTVLVERDGRVTVLNEPGPATGSAAWAGLVVAVEKRLVGESYLVCSGSVPPGSPSDAYTRVIEAGRRAGVRVVLDTSGSALGDALAAGADVVSPNLAEAEAVLYGTAAEAVEPTGDDVVPRAAAAVRDLLARGPGHAIVSAGSHGAVFDDGAGGLLWCPAPAVQVVSPIGAGDALVGGLVHALEGGRSWADAVRLAVSVAAASCEQSLAGGTDPDRVGTLLATAPPSTAVAG